MDPEKRGKRIVLTGDVPSPVNPPTGCRFHPRCPKAMPECQVMVPPAYDMGEGHFVRCLLYDPKIAGLHAPPNPELISTGDLAPGVRELQKRKGGSGPPKPRGEEKAGPLASKLPSKEEMDAAVAKVFGEAPQEAPPETEFPLDGPPTSESPTPIVLHPPEIPGEPKKRSLLDDHEEPPPGPGEEPPTKLPDWL